MAARKHKPRAKEPNLVQRDRPCKNCDGTGRCSYASSTAFQQMQCTPSSVECWMCKGRGLVKTWIEVWS